MVWDTYYSVRNEKEWLVHLECKRERRTYDLIVDMIAIYQLSVIEDVLNCKARRDELTCGAGG